MFFDPDNVTVVEFPGFGWGPWRLNRFLVKELFGRFSIAWYGVIICVGIILAAFVILHNAKKREGFNSESFSDYFLAALPLSIVGARLMYVLTSLDQYRNFVDVFKIWEGGLAVYGGVIFGTLAVWIVSRVKKDSFWKALDAIVPGLILAQAIGRWGNFVNGEAHGTVTSLPWGMTVNGEGPFHPTFFYEMLVTLSGFFLLQFLLYRRKAFDGEILCGYMVWYGVGRTLVEGLRTDSLYVGPFRISQVIGVTSALAGVILFFLLRAGSKRARPAPEAQGTTEEETPEEKEADQREEE